MACVWCACSAKVLKKNHTWLPTPDHLWNALCVQSFVFPLTSLSRYLLHLLKTIYMNEWTTEECKTVTVIWAWCYLCLRFPLLSCQASACNLWGPEVSPCLAPAHLVSWQNWWSYTSKQKDNFNVKERNLNLKKISLFNRNSVSLSAYNRWCSHLKHI